MQAQVHYFISDGHDGRKEVGKWDGIVREWPIPWARKEFNVYMDIVSSKEFIGKFNEVVEELHKPKDMPKFSKIVEALNNNKRQKAGERDLLLSS